MKNKKHNVAAKPDRTPAQIESLRRKVETTATFGLLMVAVGLALPFIDLFSELWSEIGRWVYVLGAVVYVIARMVKITDPADTMRIRRLLRLEFWAGVAFLIGAGLWFYKTIKFADIAPGGGLVIMKDTVLFTLVGAAIQLIASWMIYFQRKKLQEGTAGSVDNKKTDR